MIIPKVAQENYLAVVVVIAAIVGFKVWKNCKTLCRKVSPQATAVWNPNWLMLLPKNRFGSRKSSVKEGDLVQPDQVW